MSTPDRGARTRSGRVLACVLCQQRKVKCDRRFPCANCVKASAQCVQATLAPRQRRRRFPERELLERLQWYEGLLRENHISFEPLHTNYVDQAYHGETATGSESLGDSLMGRTPSKSESVYESPRNGWDAMNQSVWPVCEYWSEVQFH